MYSTGPPAIYTHAPHKHCQLTRIDRKFKVDCLERLQSPIDCLPFGKMMSGMYEIATLEASFAEKLLLGRQAQRALCRRLA